ncbi:MAG: hypothetical protein ACRD96_18780, partial [Bryobacteraceae bacterium]
MTARHGVVAAVAAAVVVYFAWPRARTAAPPPVSDYVAPAACAGCHAAIYKTYRQTGMGRSFGAARPDQARFDADFFHSASQRHYRMYARDGKLFQRRHQIDESGAETNVVEKEMHYVLGSGNHARTFLHRASDGRLLQLPVAWYAERGGFWAMNPGYDSPRHKDFRRAITTDCMFCHNAYPIPQPAEAVFPEALPGGIDCQRCHGPGRAHVDAQGTKASIVNPARLSRERQLEVCMQCHLES